jgi:hypothetical protein
MRKTKTQQPTTHARPGEMVRPGEFPRAADTRHGGSVNSDRQAERHGTQSVQNWMMTDLEKDGRSHQGDGRMVMGYAGMGAGARERHLRLNQAERDMGVIQTQNPNDDDSGVYRYRDDSDRGLDARKGDRDVGMRMYDDVGVHRYADVVDTERLDEASRLGGYVDEDVGVGVDVEKDRRFSKGMQVLDAIEQVHVCVCMHVCVCVCLCVYIHVYIIILLHNTYIRMCVCVCLCVCMCVYTYIYTIVILLHDTYTYARTHK